MKGLDVLICFFRLDSENNPNYPNRQLSPCGGPMNKMKARWSAGREEEAKEALPARSS